MNLCTYLDIFLKPYENKDKRGKSDKENDTHMVVLPYSTQA